MITDNALFRRIELQLLMNLTARAMQRPPLRLWTHTHGEALRLYAAFTRDGLKDGASPQLLLRMNNEAYRMGRRLRRLLLLRNQERVGRFIAELYRNIGITFEGHVPGQVCFRHCFFSAFYTPAVCLAASALDDGIIRGLSGSGPLVFSQRITEGHPCCKAIVKENVE